jgi:hypothetical protein
MFGIEVALSPAGEVAMITYGPMAPTIELGTLADGFVSRLEATQYGGNRLQWLPHRQGLVVVTADSRVHRVIPSDSGHEQIPIAALNEDRVQGVVVIPG